MLIIGVDPGSVRCGYAVLRQDKSKIDLLECGVFTAKRPANDNAGKWLRMVTIGMDFDALLMEYGVDKGDVCAIESAFIPRDRMHGVETLAEARGTMAFIAGTHGLNVVTVSPSTVKKAVTGNGNAKKDAVAEMVRIRFKLRTSPAPDASDAVGVALAVAMGGGK